MFSVFLVLLLGEVEYTYNAMFWFEEESTFV